MPKTRKPLTDAELETIRNQLQTLWDSWDEEEDPYGHGAIQAEVDLLNPLSGEELSRLYPEDETCKSMSISELASFFKTTRRTIYRWAAEDGFPTPDPGPRWCPFWILVWKNYYREPVRDRRWRGDRIR